MKNNIYIHYGSDSFDKFKFKPIKNRRFWVKPEGGLWASNIESKYGWKQWMDDNRIFNDEYFDRYEDGMFKFKLQENSKILKINNSDKLNNLFKEFEMKESYHTWKTLDFEKLSNYYDGIEVDISNDRRLYFDLYGWDCDSILIFNPDIIKELKL